MRIITNMWLDDGLDLAYMASKACYNGKIDQSKDMKQKYINSRVKEGHESVIEHTNMAMKLIVKQSDYGDLIEVISRCTYLTVFTQEYKNLPEYTKKKSLFKQAKETKVEFDDVYTEVVISGSFRGFKHIYKTIHNLNNNILLAMTEELYTNLPKNYSCFFADLIADGILDEDKFTYEVSDEEFIEADETGKLAQYFGPMLNPIKFPESDLVEVINIDDIDSLIYTLDVGNLDINDIYGMLHITVLFKELSRTSSHQLVRHRNAITQESQRYVDFSNAKFIDPLKYMDKRDEISSESVLNIPIATGVEAHLKSSEFGKLLCSYYAYLRRLGMRPEEARGYLPQNVEAGKLYMTFTWRSLCAFFKLRMDKHAQGEIRTIANALYEILDDSKYCTYFNMNKIEEVLKPYYLRAPEIYSEDGNAEIISEETSIYDIDGESVDLDTVEIGKSKSKEV